MAHCQLPSDLSTPFADVKPQLLLHLFTPIPTLELLQYAPVSQRVHSLILRILRTRLITAAELHSHTLLLECYHPSAKLTEPPYFCAYHGTDGLSAHGHFHQNESNVGMLGKMRNMYSRYRPYRRELDPSGTRVLPQPGNPPRTRTLPGTVQDIYEGETVRQMLGLEAHELFTQLIAQTNLVKVGPRNGLFTSFVGVEEGVVRVWRNWLKDTAAKDWTDTTHAVLSTTSLSTVSNSAYCGPEKGKQEVTAREAVPAIAANVCDPSILWVSPAKNTGIRFRVKERKIRRDVPVLIRADEDTSVSYEIEYEGKHIRR